MRNPSTSRSLFTRTALGGILIFALISLAFTEELNTAIGQASVWIRNVFGHYYLYLGLGCVLFLLFIALGPWGRRKLGNPGSSPEFSRWAWISMLYSTGMGAGILLRAVQEPVYMRVNPPLEGARDPGILALEYTFFQWGLTPWAFYGLFGVLVGWAMYRHGQPGLPSSAIAQTQLRSRLGWSLDLIALWTTVFGVVASVSLGARQISGGLNYLMGIRPTLIGGIIIITVICAIGGYSAYKGIRRGIRWLSVWNIRLTIGLLLFVWLARDPLGIFLPLSKAVFHYLVDFVPLSLAWGNYNPGIGFLTDWTYYYWAFWIAWAPFTGIFIARISKGRSLREFMLGVLLVPSLGTFTWFTVFGQGAFALIDQGQLLPGEFGSIFSSLFIFLGSYPLGQGLNALSMLLLFGFLITSVDSAIYVLSVFSARTRKEPPDRLKLSWTIFLGLSCVGIFFLSGLRPNLDVLDTTQKLLIVTSLPLALCMAFLPVSFIRSLFWGDS